EQRKRVPVKDRPLRDEQRQLRIRISQRANLRRDELLISLRRWIEIEGELAVKDFLRDGLDIQDADGLLRQLLDTELFECRGGLDDRSSTRLDAAEHVDLVQDQRGRNRQRI